MATERKSAWEMIGEFLRDTAVLVLVFYPLEIRTLTRIDRELIFAVSLFLLSLGIIIEVWRKE
jgi:hypothetical protein